MKHNVSLIGCACLLGLTAACTSAPADRREADIREVQDVEARWAKDAALKDPARSADYYSAADAVAIFPHSAPITGRDNIQGVLAAMMADPNFAISFQGAKAEASKGGDLVYTVGSYSLTKSDPKDKKPVTDKGKYMRVYKKQADGTWKAVADMINSDLPSQDATR